MDCKATVHLGECSRGGLTRGEHRACAHDLGCQETDIPCGIVDEESGQRSLSCGSSYKTSDFMVDALASWWHAWDAQEQKGTKSIHIKMDNGPERSGRRTPFLHRMVQFVEAIGKPVPWLYDPPYHSKDNPIERCWGILALHWNGTQLIDVATMVEWAKSMTWQGLQPMVELSHKVYQKGIALGKKAMQAVEAR
jgi:hypothetical protein